MADKNHIADKRMEEAEKIDRRASKLINYTMRLERENRELKDILKFKYGYDRDKIQTDAAEKARSKKD